MWPGFAPLEMSVSSGSGDSDLLGPCRPPLPLRARQQEQAGERVTLLAPPRGSASRDPAGPRGTPRPGQAGRGRGGRGRGGAARAPAVREAVATLVQPRGRPWGSPPRGSGLSFPSGPAPVWWAPSTVAPARGSLAHRPLGAPSPLTSDEDPLREGRCAAGGGSRGPGPAPPAPAARRRPAAAPPAAVPSGRGARVTLGAAREPPHRPLRPAASRRDRPAQVRPAPHSGCATPLPEPRLSLL